MKTQTTTCASREIPPIGIIVYGLLTSGIIVGLLTEKLFIRDFTELKFSSISAFFENARDKIDKFSKDPESKENDMVILITIACAVIFLLLHFVHGVYSSDRLIHSFVSTLFISIPVLFSVYLAHLAYIPRSANITTNTPI